MNGQERALKAEILAGMKYRDSPSCEICDNHFRRTKDPNTYCELLRERNIDARVDPGNVCDEYK